ncbi:Scr1 family TA system antitoxin-like transcriptional regulator [Glycomyces sp. NPDC047010]|uniref:Scr1 family TA system antitoxin-like transcriptional regulator n=1 Tax=Glycomyces sp. NPDC047010 TaxID=3155023 RepID=UPI003402AAEA
MTIPSALTCWQIGIHLADAREKKDLKPRQLAVMLGVSEGTINNWEKGKTLPTYPEMLGIGQTLGMDPDVAQFLANIARDKTSLNLEDSPQYNTLGLAKAELHYGSIWKANLLSFPGIIQTRAYNKQVLQPAEDLTDDEAEVGGNYKHQRQVEIKARTTPYRMSIVTSASSFYDLRVMDREARQEQIEAIREWNALPNWEIKVMNQAHDLGGTFDVYVPGRSHTAGPAFVHTQILDRSWCIEELERVEGYHGRVKKNWTRCDDVEAFLDAERNRLA